MKEYPIDTHNTGDATINYANGSASVPAGDQEVAAAKEKCRQRKRGDGGDTRKSAKARKSPKTAHKPPIKPDFVGIRKLYKACQASNAKAIRDALELARALLRIKVAIRERRVAGFKSWMAWCETMHEAGRLPFGRRQANRLLFLLAHQKDIAFKEGELFSINAAIAKARGAQTERSIWQPLYREDTDRHCAVHVAGKSIRLAMSSPAIASQLTSQDGKAAVEKSGGEAVTLATTCLSLAVSHPNLIGKLELLFQRLQAAADPVHEAAGWLGESISVMPTETASGTSAA